MAVPLACTPARAEKVSFATRLARARTTLVVDGGGLHGPGAAILATAVADARYVLIGEDHLSREIPRFTTGLCRLMAPGGLDALAVEIGPEAARVVNDVLRRPDRIARLAAFMQAHPDAFAFQNGLDESDMAAQCARLAGPHFQVWGLDQEFFGASGHLFELMLAARPGPVARAAIETLAAADLTATAKARASGSPSDLFLFSVTDPQLAQARAAIARDGGDRVRSLFQALVETRAIYLGQNSEAFASNGQRARLMKRTLVKHLEAGPKAPRILFKFGDVHMAKGVNALGQRDVGNFVAERAEGQGTGSLHIAVYGARGVHALYAGVGRPVRHEPFVMTQDPDYAWLKDALPDSATGARDWILIDLRPLRERSPADMSTAWRRMVEGYDMVVVAPDLTPSTLIGAN
ncbi:hypothetical protein [Sphingomonas crusticola]|uniref:hypothetical protein n=1 Tax=Sphingomonas crusticola TaxID=1697973 RepID=UPI000E24C645|nr:hypothetical protein [Sphingomonas crusticola]